MGINVGDAKERELSWLDYSYPADLSSDGKISIVRRRGRGRRARLFEVGWPDLRRVPPPDRRLARGFARRRSSAEALSPDGKWAVVATQGSPAQLRLLTTGAGEPRAADQRRHQPHFCPLVPGREDGSFSPGTRRTEEFGFYVFDLLSGKATAVVPAEGVNATAFAVSPDSQWIAGIGPDQKDVSVPGRGRRTTTGSRV
jgi:hypothetical protein